MSHDQTFVKRKTSMCQYDKFFDFAYVPKFHESMQYLASLAQDEPWSFDAAQGDYNILKNYIFHTYKRLQSENKILIENNQACLNTGLFSKANNEIYFIFSPNRNLGKQPWCLSGIKEKADRSLSLFSRLPERAEYIKNEDEHIYNINKELRVNIAHILDRSRDNINRIPTSIRDKPFLTTLFLGAIEDAKIRIAQNYRTAVFQFYENSLQYLIPLRLTGIKKPDIALAVSIQKDFYIGHTCLTLKMAYNNARLICKPMSDWLII